MENSQKEKKVEELIALLDNIKRAQPNPFFAVRLINRLEKKDENEWVWIATFITKPVTLALLSVFILGSNTLILFASEKEKTSHNITTKVFEEEDVYEPTAFYKY